MDITSATNIDQKMIAKTELDARSRKAAEEMEAAFLSVVVNQMMKDTMPSEMNGGHGEKMFRSLLGDEIAEKIAQSGGVGIASSIEQGLKAYQK